MEIEIVPVKYKLCFLFLTIFLFFSCDILRLSRFEVVSWTPGGGYFPDPEKITVSLDFSRDPDAASAERYFSLTADGTGVKGTFLWAGRKLTFTPASPLEKNADYVLSLSADTRDTKGLSMDAPFSAVFTTRPGNARPVLLKCVPEKRAEISDPRAEVSLLFSIPVPLKTLYDNVSFSPSMAGSWRLEEGGRLAVFTPVEPWTQLRQYEIRVFASLTDNNGMSMGSEFLSVFTTGVDRESPCLLGASRVAKNGEVFQLVPDRGYTGAAAEPVENGAWEKEDKLSLVFSKPVDSLFVKNYLSADDAPNLVMETQPGYANEFIFRFESVPGYGSRFTFRIKPGIKDKAGNNSKEEYIYRIIADGKYSRPPALTGIRMPMEPLNHTLEFFSAGTDSLFEKIPIKDENYPSGESIQTWIEFYFITAEGAAVDKFSLVELFRIETSNNVIAFSPRQVNDANFSAADPCPRWENLTRVEIAGNIVNSINFGIINFIIGAGLKDSLGNKNEKTFSVPVVK